MISARRLLLFICTAFFTVALFGQAPVRVRFIVRENDTHLVTPVMICITGNNSITYIPPDGKVAPTPTFPDIAFKGVAYSNAPGWAGPVRRMLGAGAVNGQRTYVYGNNPTLPYWKDSVMYQVNGDFSITLLPGKYVISIQHGNEYAPLRMSFTVSPGKKKMVQQILLKRWIDLPARGWYSGDVHAHHQWTKPSFRQYMLQLAKAEDVHVLNMLEMGDRLHTEFPPGGFGTAHRICDNNFCIVPGQEEPRSDYGHVIGLNTQALVRDTAHYNYYDLVFDRMHSNAGSLVGFAHFAYGGEGVKQGMALFAPGVDFVELLQNTQLNPADYYDYLNLGFRIAAAAGSDFPWGSTVGDGRTFVYTGDRFSADTWFQGLKEGKTFVSNGPALFFNVNGKLPGSTIIIGRSADVLVSAKAISHSAIGKIEQIDIYNGDGLLASGRNENAGDSIELKVITPIKESGWLVAVAYCKNGALAHSSPVYFEVDGKPFINKRKAPGIIVKQKLLLSQMRMDEQKKANPDKGILERLYQADAFYERLASTLQ